MIALFASVLTGIGTGLVVWYGWAAAENIRELRVRRAAARANRATEQPDLAPKRK